MRRIFLIFCWLLLVFSGFSKDEEVLWGPYVLSGITPGADYDLGNGRTYPNGYSKYLLSVSLKNIQKHSVSLYQGDVSVRIRCWGTFTDGTSFNEVRTLTVSNDPKVLLSEETKVEEVYFKAGVIEAHMEVLEITPPTIMSLLSQLENIELSARLVTTTHFQTVGSAPSGLDINAIANKLNFSFPPINGAEGYQIQWSFVDGLDFSSVALSSPQAPGSHDIISPSALPYNFDKNAAHVFLNTPEFYLPRIFDVGYIVCRYRYYGQKSNGEKVYGPWSALESGMVDDLPSGSYLKVEPSNYLSSGPNWQSTLGYSETGGTFFGVDYFDGMLQPRQSSVFNNSNNYSIVSEQFYDFVGRLVLQTLPAPNGIPSHAFHAQFNRPRQSTQRGYQHQDLNTNAAFSDDHGAGKYYSDNNNTYFSLDGSGRLPQSQGYPFSKQVFENTPESKLLAQNNPGLALRIDSISSEQHNKFTTTLYGQPVQAELNRLFRSGDVGDAAYYRKTLTTDANNQATLAYLDKEGRVIASGLVGLGENTPYLPDDIELLTLNSENIIKNTGYDEPTLWMTHALLVEKDDSPFTFHYLLRTHNIAEKYCASVSTICEGCYYDFYFEIVDSKGEIAIDNQGNACTASFMIDGQSLTNPSCGSGYDETWDESDWNLPNGLDEAKFILDKGSYQINRKLTINWEAIESRREGFVARNMACANIDTWIEEELERLDIDDCDEEQLDNCLEDCRASSGSILEFYQCMHACGNITSKCLMDSFQLQQDITPIAGQFVDSNLSDPYNIFNRTGAWAFDRNHVLNTYGNNHFNVVFDNQDLNLTQQTSEWILENWQPEWETIFMVSHPEYPCLELCGNEVLEYQNIFGFVLDYKDAFALGLMNPDPNIFPEIPTSGVYNDPILNYLQTNNYQDLYDDFVDHLRTGYTDMLDCNNQEVSIWDICIVFAYHMVGTNLSPCEIYEEIQEEGLGAYYSTSSTCLPQNFLWIIYKALYTQEKTELLNLFFEACGDHEDFPWDGSGKERRFVYDLNSVMSSTFPEFDYDEIFNADSLANGNFFDQISGLTQGQGDSLLNGANYCSGMRSYWEQKLEYCDITSTKKKQLLEAFEAICIEGSNDTIGWIFGARDGAMAPDTSFEAAMKRVLTVDEYGQLCNEYLIDVPRTQADRRLVPDHAPYADVCVCEAYLEADYDYSQMPNDFDDLDDYLFALYGQTPNNTDAILCQCAQQYSSMHNGQRDWYDDKALDAVAWPEDASEILAENINRSLALLSNTVCKKCTTCDTITDLVNDATTLWESLTPSPGANSLLEDEIFGVFVENYVNEELHTRLDDEAIIAFAELCTSDSAVFCSYDERMISDVNALFSTLSGDNKLRSSVCLCADPYALRPNGGFRNYSNYLAGHVESGFDRTYCDHEYVYTGTNADGVYSAEIQVSGMTGCTINLWAADTLDKELVSEIYSLRNIVPESCPLNQPNSTCSTYNFSAIAVTTSPLNPLGEFKVYGSTTCFPLGECTNNKDDFVLCEGDWEFMEDLTRSEDNPCVAEYMDIARSRVMNRIEDLRETLHQTFDELYARCSEVDEDLNFDYTMYDNPMTLYYYDLSGNLIRTVAPKGFDGSSGDAAHTYPTDYWYDSRNALRVERMPDQEDTISLANNSVEELGSTLYRYDSRGRMTRKMSSEQSNRWAETYILYDKHNRVIETGEHSSGHRYNVVRTIYDNRVEPGFGENLRERVAAVIKYRKVVGQPHVALPPYPAEVDNATLYSYDELGNVATVLQKHFILHPPLSFRVDYSYDLLTGNVKQVEYQPKKVDKFIQRYHYDADNRLDRVESSRDYIIWNRDAEYYYYPHGALHRMVLDNDVQGLDYSYTIQGWLKGINLVTHNTGFNSVPNPVDGLDFSGVASDAFSQKLDYFLGDYVPVIQNTGAFGGGFGQVGGAIVDGVSASSEYDLFNGNIKSQTLNVYPDLTENLSDLDLVALPLTSNAKGYQYDQLNRLRKSFNLDPNMQTSWDSEYTFDVNGNLKSLQRIGDQPSSSEEVAYVYENGKPNQLSKVNVSGSSMPTFNSDETGESDFVYDAAGRLTTDGMIGAQIEWNSDNKVVRVTKENVELLFGYDGSGNRVYKVVKPLLGGQPVGEEQWEITLYVRDAQGNLMSTYNSVQTELAGKITERIVQDQVYVYGSERLGSYRSAVEIRRGTFSTTGGVDEEGFYVRSNFTGQVGSVGLFPVVTPNAEWFTGRKQYELKNHLGNVVSTITDRKRAVIGATQLSVTTPFGTVLVPGEGIVSWAPEVVSVTDYYPGGSILPGRNFNSNEYRFGYQGSEKDDEISGNGNSYTTHFRQLDTRLLRWWSIDPKASAMPWQSPYLSMDGNPIRFNDPFGDQVDPTSSGYADAKNRASEFKENRRGKLKKNKDYEPEFAKLFNEWDSNDDILVQFEKGEVDGGTKGGTIEFRGESGDQKVYGVLWDPSQTKKLGASGLFEESYHLKDALEGVEAAFPEKPFTGVMGWDIYDEVRAKQWVANNIRSVKSTYKLGGDYHGYTHYGYIKKLGDKDVIKATLMNGAPALSPIYRGTGSSGSSMGGVRIDSYTPSNFGGKYSGFSPTPRKP